MNLKNRVILVTGASKGIGKAIVNQLAGRGANVILCSRNKSLLEQNVNELLAAEQLADFVVGDLTNEESVKEVIESIITRHGALDILVNNAGGAIKYGDFFQLSVQDWKNTLDLNLISVVNVTKYALPYLKKSKSPKIINISSLTGAQPGSHNPHYAASKAAVINLSKSLSNFLAKDNILVNTICPGPVFTESWEENADSFAQSLGISKEKAIEELKNQESTKIPLERIGEANDVAQLVAFLASDHSGWITGSCYFIDGGKYRPMF